MKIIYRLKREAVKAEVSPLHQYEKEIPTPCQAVHRNVKFIMTYHRPNEAILLIKDTK